MINKEKEFDEVYEEVYGEMYNNLYSNVLIPLVTNRVYVLAWRELVGAWNMAWEFYVSKIEETSIDEEG